MRGDVGRRIFLWPAVAARGGGEKLIIVNSFMVTVLVAESSVPCGGRACHRDLWPIGLPFQAPSCRIFQPSKEALFMPHLSTFKGVRGFVSSAINRDLVTLSNFLGSLVLIS
jgi:hypothetical protein